jgi:hypothetical protein
MVTARQNTEAQKEKARAARYRSAKKKKPALQARAKNFQGVVLQRRTAFMVLANAGLYFAQTQSGRCLVP